MRIVFLFIMINALFIYLLAQNDSLRIAPLNPAFIKYMENLTKNRLDKCPCSDYPSGYIPHPVKLRTEVTESLKKIMQLPVRYDLRDEGKVTPVKNQSSCGSCWTFATMGSIESRWLDLGLGTFDLSEQNLKNGHGFLWGHCDGGNSWMATAYLVRGNGPVAEADDPYNINDSTYTSIETLQGYVTDYRALPNDRTIIKQAIMESGAVYNTMYYDTTYYNRTDTSYFCNLPDLTNHAILLVGWDDNKNTAADNDGAWIVKNSWGTAFGDNGYFYISYDDSSINQDIAFWPGRINYNANASVYGYDKLGSIGSAGYGQDDTDYALVKFIIAGNQYLSKIGTFVLVANSTLSVEIYDDFNGQSLNNLLSAINDTVCSYAGYYTFNLPSYLYLTSGEDIYIKVKYSTPDEAYPIPVEMYIEDFAEPDIESDCCWISNNGTNTWSAIGNNTTNNKWDLCIKAYCTTDQPTKVSKENILPDQFSLSQNYPNPFNPNTMIEYSVPEYGKVELEVFNIIGRSVIKLVDGFKTNGIYKVEFNGENLASGVYFYRLKTDQFITTRKMILMR
jgi:C1A family cysteine protease